MLDIKHVQIKIKTWTKFNQHKAISGNWKTRRKINAMKIWLLKLENKHILNRSNCEKFKGRILVKFNIFISCLTVFDVRTLLFYHKFQLPPEAFMNLLEECSGYLFDCILNFHLHLFNCLRKRKRKHIIFHIAPKKKIQGRYVRWSGWPIQHILIRGTGSADPSARKRCVKQCTCCKTPVGRSPVLLKHGSGFVTKFG